MASQKRQLEDNWNEEKYVKIEVHIVTLQINMYKPSFEIVKLVQHTCCVCQRPACSHDRTLIVVLLSSKLAVTRFLLDIEMLEVSTQFGLSSLYFQDMKRV